MEVDDDADRSVAAGFDEVDVVLVGDLTLDDAADVGAGGPAVDLAQEGLNLSSSTASASLQKATGGR